MNKILVEVSVGELLDKLTILEIKKDKIKEIDSIKAEKEKMGKDFVLRLKDANDKYINLQNKFISALINQNKANQ